MLCAWRGGFQERLSQISKLVDGNVLVLGGRVGDSARRRKLPSNRTTSEAVRPKATRPTIITKTNVSLSFRSLVCVFPTAHHTAMLMEYGNKIDKTATCPHGTTVGSREKEMRHKNCSSPCLWKHHKPKEGCQSADGLPRQTIVRPDSIARTHRRLKRPPR